MRISLLAALAAGVLLASAPVEAQQPIVIKFSHVVAPDTPKIPGDGPFRNDKAELLKFSVDLGGSPIRVLFHQTSDEVTNLFGDPRPAAPWLEAPAPVAAETGAMPADHTLRLYDHEDISPAAPKSAEGRPEKSVKRI